VPADTGVGARKQPVVGPPHRPRVTSRWTEAPTPMPATPGLSMSFDTSGLASAVADEATGGGAFRDVVLRSPTLEPGAASTASAPRAPSVIAQGTPRDTIHRSTGRPRVRAITYSDAYATRLTIHRVASYATIPLFIGNYVTGSQLLAKGRDAPGWALHTHGPLATGVTTLFTVNTVTGVWNMAEAWHDPAGRFSRTLHGLLMIISDAGFTYTGILSGEARNSESRRRLHREVALSSIGVATLGYVIMLPPFHK
jgi:hypothetical protein